MQTFGSATYPGECQELTDEQQGSFLPILAASKNPQTIYIGTPPDENAPGEVFARVRADAISGKSKKTAWSEWSVSEIGDVNDPTRWAESNPSMGYMIMQSTIAAEAEQMAPDKFARERLGAWLDTNAVKAVIGHDAWNACATDEPPSGGTVTYSVKCSPDDAEMVVAACAKGDGFAHFEVVMEQPTSMGIGSVADWLAERSKDAAQIVIDGHGVAQTLTDRLKSLGVPERVLIRPRSRDVANACATLLDAINEKSCTHFGQQALDEAAKVCSKRNIGTSGGWGFAGDGAMLLEAVALAHWGAINTKRNPQRRMRMG